MHPAPAASTSSVTSHHAASATTSKIDLCGIFCMYVICMCRCMYVCMYVWMIDFSLPVGAVPVMSPRLMNLASSVDGTKQIVSVCMYVCMYVCMIICMLV